MKRQKFYLILTILCISLLFSCANVYAWACFDHHWATNTTYWYNIGSSFNDSAVYKVTLADNQWNGISNRKVYLANDNKTRNTASSPSRNSQNAIFKINAGTGQYLGQTTMWISSDNIILEADIAVNTSYTWSYADPVESNKYDFCTCILHEFGHVLGLADEYYYTTSVMYYQLDTGEMRRKLTTDDKNGYNNILW